MTTAETTMERSWLVQRLTKPRSGGPLGPDNPFAFGGGRRNGGLTDEAMGLLRGIFAFDYMGASEFEWGAVPQALQGLARDGDALCADSFRIALKDVVGDWRDRKSKVVPEGDSEVFVLCRQAHRPEVERRIRAWALEGYRADLKEATHLASTLRPTREWDGETVGWLELDNGFLFFTDEAMWRSTCDLFGVRPSAGGLVTTPGKPSESTTLAVDVLPLRR